MVDASRPARQEYGLGRIHLIFYAAASSITVLLLCILNPPFQSPDEPQHFYRSFQISELQIAPVQRDGRTGGYVPASMVKAVENYLGTSELHTRRDIAPSPFRATLTRLGQPLQADRRSYREFASAYVPIAYVPQAIGIAAARSFGAGPLELLYAGRLANAIAALALTALAIHVTPVGRGTLMLLGMLPATQFQYASCSADAVTLAGCFVLAAVILRSTLAGTAEYGKTAIGLIAGAAAKLAYLPLAIAALSSELCRSPRRRPMIFGHSLLVACATSLVLVWLIIARGSLYATGPEADVSAQLRLVLASPLVLLKAVSESIASYHVQYLVQAIGVFGWLNVYLPIWVYLSAIVALPVSYLTDERSVRIPNIVLAMWSFLICASIGLVFLAVYLAWSAVGAARVEGVQGRYFLPVMPLLLASVAPQVSAGIGKNRRLSYLAILCCLCTAMCVASVWTIVSTYSLI